MCTFYERKAEVEMRTEGESKIRKFTEICVHIILQKQCTYINFNSVLLSGEG